MQLWSFQLLSESLVHQTLSTTTWFLQQTFHCHNTTLPNVCELDLNCFKCKLLLLKQDVWEVQREKGKLYFATLLCFKLPAMAMCPNYTTGNEQTIRMVENIVRKLFASIRKFRHQVIVTVCTSNCKWICKKRGKRNSVSIETLKEKAACRHA